MPERFQLLSDTVLKPDSLFDTCNRGNSPGFWTFSFEPITNAAGWYIIRSSTRQGMAVKWGTMSDLPVPADYDYDGKTDVAVWRPGTPSAFFILRSGSTPTAVAWGEKFDLPVAR